MQHGNGTQAQLIKTAIEQGGIEQIDEITRAIEETGALRYTQSAARKEADQAIQALASIPDSQYKQALITLANFSVDRSY